MKSRRKENFRIKPGFNIGGIAAETDPFLDTCFLPTACFESTIEIDDPKCAIIGSSGTGKTAIIGEIQKCKPDNCTIIDPESLSFQFLGKSEMIRSLKNSGVNLDYFYKLLWRHVLVVEILKHCFPQEAKRYRFISQLLDSIKKTMKPDPNRKLAINYLDEWDAQVLQKPQERIKEIHDNLSKRIRARLGYSIPWSEVFGLSPSIEGEIVKTTEAKERIQIANEVISSIQVQDLNAAKDYISLNILDDPQKPLFVLIDDLDRFWVEDHIVYDLIKGLILEIYEWRNSENIKIVYVLRNNILNKIEKEFVTRSYQKEKLEDQRYYLRWNRAELVGIVNKRLEKICADNNFINTPNLHQILPKKRSNQPAGLDYILTRTLDRPRDIIDYINKAGSLSIGKNTISMQSLRDSEESYSLGRLQALYDEWRDNYPGLDIFTKLVYGYPPRFRLTYWSEDDILEALTDIKTGSYAWITKMCADLQSDYQKNPTYAIEQGRRRILKILFEVGIVGIRSTETSSIRYCHTGDPLLSDTEIEGDTVVIIHPMFYKALSIDKR